MLIGAHVKSEDPIAMAAQTGADCVQIFLGNPQSWKVPPPRDDAEAIVSWGLPVYVHAPYLVNLASPNNKIRIPSRKILQQCCDAAVAVKAKAIIVHGGHVTADDVPGEGYTRWRKGLEQLSTDIPIYLENTAGGDHAMAREFDTIAKLWDAIGDMGVGFCLDTCHAHSAGEDLGSAVDKILAITGRIDLVHCNDSRDPAGSGADRHQTLGQGTIPVDVLADVCRRAGAPVICETPFDGMKDDIALLRELTS